MLYATGEEQYTLVTSVCACSSLYCLARLSMSTLLARGFTCHGADAKSEICSERFHCGLGRTKKIPPYNLHGLTGVLDL
jgi:hypothetical protein